MTSWGNLLCLMVGVLLPLVAITWALRRGLRPLAAASAYRNVAWRLGLDADTRGASLQGYLDDRRLFVGEVPEDRGRSVLAVLDLHAPLGVGLLARHRGRRRLARWRRAPSSSLQTGDPDVDDRLSIRAFEPERARTLFRDDVREALCALLDDWPEVVLTDHWVQVRAARPPSSDRQLMGLVNALRRVAEALEAARRVLPASPDAEPWLAPWQALAEARGLQLVPELPAIEGIEAGHEVSVVAARTADGLRADVRVGFSSRNLLGLQITPQESPDGFWSVGQDIQVGDPPFDAAWVVKGYDPAAVIRAVGPVSRGHLQALAQHGRVRVTDVGVDVEGAPMDPEVLGPLLDRAVALGEALDR